MAHPYKVTDDRLRRQLLLSKMHRDPRIVFLPPSVDVDEWETEIDTILVLETHNDFGETEVWIRWNGPGCSINLELRHPDHHSFDAEMQVNRSPRPPCVDLVEYIDDTHPRFADVYASLRWHCLDRWTLSMRDGDN